MSMLEVVWASFFCGMLLGGVHAVTVSFVMFCWVCAKTKGRLPVDVFVCFSTFVESVLNHVESTLGKMLGREWCFVFFVGWLLDVVGLHWPHSQLVPVSQAESSEFCQGPMGHACGHAVRRGAAWYWDSHGVQSLSSLLFLHAAVEITMAHLK